MFNFRFTVTVSPAFINTFSKPFNCFVGEDGACDAVDEHISTVSLPSILPLSQHQPIRLFLSSFLLCFGISVGLNIQIRVGKTVTEFRIHSLFPNQHTDRRANPRIDCSSKVFGHCDAGKKLSIYRSD